MSPWFLQYFSDGKFSSARQSYIQCAHCMYTNKLSPWCFITKRKIKLIHSSQFFTTINLSPSSVAYSAWNDAFGDDC